MIAKEVNIPLWLERGWVEMTLAIAIVVAVLNSMIVMGQPFLGPGSSTPRVLRPGFLFVFPPIQNTSIQNTQHSIPIINPLYLF